MDFFEGVLQLDVTALFKWNLCSISCCIKWAFIWQINYRFQQLTIQSC